MTRQNANILQEEKEKKERRNGETEKAFSNCCREGERMGMLKIILDLTDTLKIKQKFIPREARSRRREQPRSLHQIHSNHIRKKTHHYEVVSRGNKNLTEKISLLCPECELNNTGPTMVDASLCDKEWKFSLREKCLISLPLLRRGERGKCGKCACEWSGKPEELVVEVDD